jgi:hypothetical protein|tara:strand:+ start:219 stop:437 length:219 start_codon:yes stop_codon:yes gene_type:complete
MKVGTKFKIGYRAKKYNDEFIWREGIWTDECRMWTDKSGQAIFTYYDVEKEGYRNATRDWVFTSSTIKQGVN